LAIDGFAPGVVSDGALAVQLTVMNATKNARAA
jgi:hypothetical protein